MTVKDLQQFKFARSPMWDYVVVKIVKVREDEDGLPIIDGRVGGKVCLFRVSELTDFRS